MNICLKVNTIAQLEFGLIYNNIVVEYISHYTMGILTSSSCFD